MQVDFFDGHRVKRAAEAAHGREVQTVVIIVSGLVDQIEIALDQERTWSLCRNDPEFV
jgi:hypothetical protein